MTTGLMLSAATTLTARPGTCGAELGSRTIAAVAIAKSRPLATTPPASCPIRLRSAKPLPSFPDVTIGILEQKRLLGVIDCFAGMGNAQADPWLRDRRRRSRGPRSRFPSPWRLRHRRRGAGLRSAKLGFCQSTCQVSSDVCYSAHPRVASFSRFSHFERVTWRACRKQARRQPARRSRSAEPRRREQADSRKCRDQRRTRD